MQVRKHLFFFVIIAAFACLPLAVGCGGGSKKKSPASSGGSTGSGTGTGGGTGTGSGGNGGGGNAGTAVACDETWTVNPDADQAWLEAFANKIQSSQKLMWRGVEGQMYMRNVDLHDNDPQQSSGVIITHLTGGSSGGGGSNPGQFIWLRGEYLDVLFCHEWGHYKFIRYAEEYSCKCLLGSSFGQTAYCDASNCAVGEPCWETYILKKYPNWKHPNSGYDQTAPQVNITIDNR
ncbi:MAG: hypothetical protein E3J72_11455 [Planctomycetota bacterium]|nr:MAG: hypothetical protein E3J72_11455 [Planctomycetota bacterium]